jgi:hypothetical protein
MKASGGLEGRTASELGGVINKAGQGAAGPAGEVAKFFGLSGAPLRAGYALSSGTDNFYRMSLMLDRLRKGYSREEALGEVMRVFFDYRDLTKLESKFTDFGFFYNFYRNNLRYITQEVGEKPQLTKQFSQLFHNDPDDPRSNWMSDRGFLRIAGMDVGLGFVPQQQFNMFDLAEGDVFDKVSHKSAQGIGQLNPLIVAAAETAFQTDLYSGAPIEWRSRVGDFSAAPEWLQDMIGFAPTASGDYRMDPVWKFLFEAMPAMGRAMSTKVVMDDRDRTFMEKSAQLLTGVRAQDDELAEGAVNLLTRNIDRQGKALDHLKQFSPGNWHVDRSTKEGRILSAFTSPTGEEIKYLALRPELLQELHPYMSFKPDGNVEMNKLLRDRMQGVFAREYPDYAALWAAMEMRRKSVTRSPLPMDVEAADALAAFLEGTG